MKSNKQLYTTKEVKEERLRLYNLQKGIDPILKQHVEFNTTTCDHDHFKHNTRSALHRQTNSFEGRVVNAYIRGLRWLTDLPLPDILRNLAEYLEKDYSSNPYHPDALKSCQSRFNALNEKSKTNVLHNMALPDGKNGAERKDIFRKGLLSRRYTFTQIEHIIQKEKSL